jgi:class 3 adenylate cyclase/tetratricopeptide (TPR) repeat protein
MDERQRIEQAIAAQESLRATVGGEVVDETISMLRKELAQLKTPEQQRKLASIMYADIVGSTDMIKHLDPEEALEIMDGSLKRLAIPVEEHGGRVTRFMGDGFKSIFGAPVAQENDPEMAVRAGLDILETAQELAIEMEAQWGICDFQVRVGVNTGLVVLGGTTEAEDTAMGSSVHLAKRVENAAPPGGLLITHHTYRHVRGVFDVEPRQSIEAKGFDEPIPVYLVMGIKSRAFRVRTPGIEGIETPMVGRDEELHTLQEAYRNTVEGKQMQVITVVGEAGVGKSRLLYEFDNWIELLPDVVRFFQGRGRQETRQIPYALLKDLFVFRFQIHESDKISTVRKKVEEGFGVVFGEDDGAHMRAHIIGQLLGFDFSESKYVNSILDDPQQIHDRALMYLADYFQGMSDQAPTVIFLEDTHWADDSSLDMITRLTHKLPEKPILIVCLARHRLLEHRPDWGTRMVYHNKLALEPLSQKESYRLVGEILKLVDQLPENLCELVVGNAEGNPFYVEELIKMLIEDGVIVIGERWRVEPERLAEVKVPSTLTSVLQARLDGLPSAEKEILQQASVVGRTFWDESVAFINTETKSSDLPSSLRTSSENLSSLQSRELIYHQAESTFANAAEYTFKHAILRDVTYESVLLRLRRIYHGLVADWLIMRSGGRQGEHLGLIGDHLERAGRTEEALKYYHQAGNQAAANFANMEALRYLNQALDLTAQTEFAKRYELVSAREEIHHTQGQRGIQREDLAILQELADLLGDDEKRSEVALRQAKLGKDTGDYDSAISSAKRVIALAQTSGITYREAEGYLEWGRALIRLGDLADAVTRMDRARTLAQSASAPGVEADSLRGLGIIAVQQGNLMEARDSFEESLHLSQAIGDRRGEYRTLNNLGMVASYQGDFVAAQSYYERSLNWSRKIGDRPGESIGMVNLGFLAYNQGDFSYARATFEQALDLLNEVGNRSGISTVYLNLGAMAALEGDYCKAKDSYEESLRILREMGERTGECMVLSNLAELACDQGDYPGAQSLFDETLHLCRERGERREECFALAGMGLLYHYLGNNTTAREHCDQALLLIRELGLRELEGSVLTVLGFILQGLSHTDQAAEAFQQSLRMQRDQGKHDYAMESLAGLASIALGEGEFENALVDVDEILTFLEENKLRSVADMRVYLICYQVLKAASDPRAEAVLDVAHSLLQERAAKIPDEQLRRSFLENVPYNWEILAAYTSAE